MAAACLTTESSTEEEEEYLLANCTNPHPFPIGIFTDTTSPNLEKGCLRSSSLTSESRPPTNI